MVCGPRLDRAGAQADEYVDRSQLELCERFMRRLLDRLEQGPLAFPR